MDIFTVYSFSTFFNQKTIRLCLFVSTEKLISSTVFHTCFVEFHLPWLELCLKFSVLGQEQLIISTSNINYNVNQTNRDT